jgi:hypothetical protein
MKLLELYPLDIGNITHEAAYEHIFGEAMLRKFHGANFKLKHINSTNRIIKFEVHVDNIPTELKRFFCGKNLRVTTKQNLNCQDQPNIWKITSKVRMHFLGAEFFKVEHHAILPPPLNTIAEHFMHQQTQKEMNQFLELFQQ